MYAEGQRKMSLERFVRLMQCIFEMSEKNATEFFKVGNTDESTSDKPIDLGNFKKYSEFWKSNSEIIYDRE